MNKLSIITLASLLTVSAASAKQSTQTLSSPDGKITVTVNTGDKLAYSIALNGRTVLEQTPISIDIAGGKSIGTSLKGVSARKGKVDGTVPSPFYRSTSIAEKYNSLTLKVDREWNVDFRAYDDGVAYRFEYTGKKPLDIAAENARFTFTGDAVATVPYVKAEEGASFEKQFFNSFENTYTTAKLSALDSRRLIFTPAVVEAVPGVKLMFMESGLLNYPGMYLNKTDGNALRAMFAPYPKTTQQGGHNKLQSLVKSRETYIAHIDGPRALPWRVCVVADDDRTLASTELSYLLAEPSRVTDTSWIKPGKVAWDWWNAWNIDGVDFEAGINNQTYKFYIDFASKYGIEYVILDEGWAVNKKADLFQVVPEINLEELVEYARTKNVGLILWAGYYAFNRDMEHVCKHYSEMGIKGFKVDFMDRDDQQMTDFEDRAAAMAAKYGLVLDLHGSYKPAGMNRTYPNVLNFEGVHGLEQMKWSKQGVDQVTYDVQLPFIRQASGPMDYTQGAMRNATKKNYAPVNSEPMSQGTRCRQLAMYMVFDAPLNMLCDSPSAYMREPECTEFIAGVPTYWDETRILAGKMGEYIITARRKGDNWYIGGMTNWDARDMELDLSFLESGKTYEADIFADGVNAHRIARDFRHYSTTVEAGTKLPLHAAPGGGFALKLTLN